MGVLASLLLAGGLAVLTPPPASPEALASSIWRPLEWTDFSGREWTSEDLEGRVVLLDFWATWCPPCLAEMPNLRTLEERYGDRGLVLVGVALDSIERRRLHAFLLRHDIPWTQVHEPRGVDSAIAQRFQVQAVPTTLLIDRKGRIVARDLRGRALEVTAGTLLDGHGPRGRVARATASR